VFARVGYHGLSAELIIEEAGISRPTFYKYFRSTEEPVEVLVSQVNDDLIARLMAAVAAAPDPLAKVESAILAWRQWGEDLGEFLRPFFAELNNPATPVGRHRQQTLTLLTGQIAGIIELLGHARPATCASRPSCTASSSSATTSTSIPRATMPAGRKRARRCSVWPSACWARQSTGGEPWRWPATGTSISTVTERHAAGE